MILRVGPYHYRIKLVEGYIVYEGKNCLGLCDNDRHEILVSDIANESQQVQIICHEYMEAWIYHFADHLACEPAKEAFCDLFGLAMTQCILDFVSQFRRVQSNDTSVDPCEGPGSSPTTGPEPGKPGIGMSPPLRGRFKVTQSYEQDMHAPDRYWLVQIFDGYPTSAAPQRFVPVGNQGADDNADPSHGGGPANRVAYFLVVIHLVLSHCQ